MAQKTAKVSVIYHPIIKGVSHEVPAAKLGDWVDQGWVADKPPTETSPATE